MQDLNTGRWDGGRNRPQSSAAAEAAKLARASQDGGMSGVASVTLMLPPRTRIQACVGVLNHLRVPSGCLFHFVGSSECVLPTGACATLPGGPARSHMVMLQKGVVAVLPHLPQVGPARCCPPRHPTH